MSELYGAYYNLSVYFFNRVMPGCLDVSVGTSEQEWPDARPKTDQMRE